MRTCSLSFKTEDACEIVRPSSWRLFLSVSENFRRATLLYLPELRLGLAELLQAVGIEQDITGLRAVGRSDDALRLEHVHDASSSSIPNSELALQPGRGTQLGFHDDLGSLPDEGVLIAVGGIARGAGLARSDERQDVLVVVGRGLGADELDRLIDILVGDEAALRALGAASAQLDEHIAVAEQALGAGRSSCRCRPRAPRGCRYWP